MWNVSHTESQVIVDMLPNRDIVNVDVLACSGSCWSSKGRTAMLFAHLLEHPEFQAAINTNGSARGFTVVHKENQFFNRMDSWNQGPVPYLN
jgi:predicted Zn-dependent peptidase